MFTDRTAALLGQTAVDKLSEKRVAIFGIGGVGGYLAEALARSGVGHLDLIDGDVVSETNLNRQIIALQSTIGMPKAEVMAARLKDINPDIEVRTYNIYFSPKTADSLPLNEYDYIADAIDSVDSKLELITRAVQSKRAIISAMGAGNKYDPERFKITDVSKTTNCGLARVIRRELRSRGIYRLAVVASDEPPAESATDENGKRVPASVIYCPAVMGLLMAKKIISDLI